MPEPGRVRRALLRGGIALALLASGYYLTFGGEYSVFDLRELRDARDRAAARVDSLQGQVDSLRARADSLEADSLAMERVARERHGFVRDGERVYRFVGEVAPTPDSGSVDDRNPGKYDG